MNTLKSIHVGFHEFSSKIILIITGQIFYQGLFMRWMHPNGSINYKPLREQRIASHKIPDGLYVACHIYWIMFDCPGADSMHLNSNRMDRYSIVVNQ